VKNKNGRTDVFIIDSGAECCLARSSSLLIDLERRQDTVKVQDASGGEHVCKEQGTLVLKGCNQGEIKINNTVVHGKLPFKELISVAILTDTGLICVFTSLRFFAFQEGQLVLTGSRNGNLYTLDKGTRRILLTSEKRELDSIQDHLRLGHFKGKKLQAWTSMSIEGFTYATILTDEATRFIWAILCRKKSDVADAVSILLEQEQRRTSLVINQITRDGGSEFFQVRVPNVQVQENLAYDHQANGMIEQTIQLVSDKARALLHAASMPICYWSFALRYSVLLLNSCPREALQFHSAKQVLRCHDRLQNKSSKGSDHRSFPLWGSLVHAHTAKEVRADKMSSHSESSIFLGFVGSEQHIMEVWYAGKVHHTRTIRETDRFPTASEQRLLDVIDEPDDGETFLLEEDPEEDPPIVLPPPPAAESSYPPLNTRPVFPLSESSSEASENSLEEKEISLKMKGTHITDSVLIERISLIASLIERISLIASLIERISLIASPIERISLIASPIERISLIASLIERISLIASLIERISLIASLILLKRRERISLIALTM
jgi:hypothetical protein